MRFKLHLADPFQLICFNPHSLLCSFPLHSRQFSYPIHIPSTFIIPMHANDFLLQLFTILLLRAFYGHRNCSAALSQGSSKMSTLNEWRNSQSMTYGSWQLVNKYSSFLDPEQLCGIFYTASQRCASGTEPHRISAVCIRH